MRRRPARLGETPRRPNPGPPGFAGPVPPAPPGLKVHLTRTLEGDGYRIEDLVFESRPGLVVTANLYAPARTPRSMPGILISHSHHNPKDQGELQDMGMTWARNGCTVLFAARRLGPRPT